MFCRWEVTHGPPSTGLTLWWLQLPGIDEEQGEKHHRSSWITNTLCSKHNHADIFSWAEDEFQMRSETSENTTTATKDSQSQHGYETVFKHNHAWQEKNAGKKRLSIYKATRCEFTSCNWSNNRFKWREEHRLNTITFQFGFVWSDRLIISLRSAGVKRSKRDKRKFGLPSCPWMCSVDITWYLWSMRKPTLKHCSLCPHFLFFWHARIPLR